MTATTVRVHILEGDEAEPDGRLIFACGRKAACTINLYVGRALIIAGKRHDDVTCKNCRRAWPYFLDGERRR